MAFYGHVRASHDRERGLSYEILVKRGQNEFFFYFVVIDEIKSPFLQVSRAWRPDKGLFEQFYLGRFHGRIFESPDGPSFFYGFKDFHYSPPQNIMTKIEGAFLRRKGGGGYPPPQIIMTILAGSFLRRKAGVSSPHP